MLILTKTRLDIQMGKEHWFLGHTHGCPENRGKLSWEDYTGYTFYRTEENRELQ